jgi:GT2 family glycosyltransferase
MSEGQGHSVSCVVVNYFCSQLTLSAVRSFAVQCPQGQVIVVDNSADPHEFEALLTGLPAGCVLIPQKENSGFAVACNLAAARCDRDFILLLNPDALLLSDCVDQLVSSLQQRPDLAAVSPVQFWDRAQKWMLPPAWLPTGLGSWALTVASQSHRSAHRLSMAYRRLALQVWSAPPQAVVEQRALSGGAMLLRRSAVNALPQLFDPAFFMYYEDSDLCLQLRRRGQKLAMVRSAQVIHEWEHSDSKIQMMERSRSHYFSSNFNGQGLWEQRLAKATVKSSLDNPLQAQSLERNTAEIAVPCSWQESWLLEVSPSPLLTPALGCLGSGPVAQLDWSLMNRLGDQSRFFVRLSPCDKTTSEVQTFVVPASAA